MPDSLVNLWEGLSAGAQDSALLVLLLLPVLLIGIVLVAGYQPFQLVRSLLWRYRVINLIFIILIAVSVGLGAGLIAQERALRVGTARAADKFDLIIAAPGSEVNMLLSAVYLQPDSASLLDGDVLNELDAHEHVEFAAPLAFGDSYKGAAIVGTTTVFVRHLSAELAAGRLFENTFEAVAGASSPVNVGDTFEAAHGLDDDASAGAHGGSPLTVVGRMQPTGTPWDQALVVPIEAVWQVHGMGSGHAPAATQHLGAPFDKRYFPGTPAIVVHASQLSAYYGLHNQFNRVDTMAFFPGAVLTGLHGVLGNMRQVMSLLAVLTQVLVAGGVLAGLVILMRLFARRLALLRALGAPARFIIAVLWCYTAVLLFVGTLLGLVTGYFATRVISAIITERTSILVQSALGWSEIHLAAVFLGLAMLIGLLPAFSTLRRSVMSELRH